MQVLGSGIGLGPIFLASPEAMLKATCSLSGSSQVHFPRASRMQRKARNPGYVGTDGFLAGRPCPGPAVLPFPKQGLFRQTFCSCFQASLASHVPFDLCSNSLVLHQYRHILGLWQPDIGPYGGLLNVVVSTEGRPADLRVAFCPGRS